MDLDDSQKLLPDTHQLTFHIQEDSGWKRTGPKVLMVSQESAIYATPKENRDDIFSIDSNHSEMVKFDHNACQDYLNISSRIIALVESAQVVVDKRFKRLREGMD